MSKLHQKQIDCLDLDTSKFERDLEQDRKALAETKDIDVMRLLANSARRNRLEINERKDKRAVLLQQQRLEGVESEVDDPSKEEVRRLDTVEMAYKTTPGKKRIAVKVSEEIRYVKAFLAGSLSENEYDICHKIARLCYKAEVSGGVIDYSKVVVDGGLPPTEINLGKFEAIATLERLRKLFNKDNIASYNMLIEWVWNNSSLRDIGKCHGIDHKAVKRRLKDCFAILEGKI